MEKSALNEIKAILKSLVLSSTDKITIEQLNKDYRNVEGEFIPYRKLGYGGLEQFLRSMSDTLKVFGSGPTAMVCFVGNEKSNHIHDMIMRQKKTKSKNSLSRPKNFNRNQNSVCPQNRSNKYNANNQQSTKKWGQQLSPFQSVNRNQATKTVQVRNVPALVQKPSNATSLLGDPFLYALPQPNGIVLNVQQTLNYNNALQSMQTDLVKTIVANNARKYEEHVKQVSSLLKNQCHITTTPPPPLIRQQTKCVQFSTDLKKEEYSFKCPAENKNVAYNDIKNTSDAKQVPREFTNEFESLQSMPKLTKATNPIKEPTRNESVKDLQEVKQVIKSKDVNNKLFFDESADKVEDYDEAVPSYAAKNNVFSLDFPEDTVPYGGKIAPFKLSDDITVGSVIKIFISEIHNPFKFWYHIHKDNHELDMLMYQIERFYSSLRADDLRIPTICLTPSQVCAASYNGLWHRAEIVAPPVNTTIKVSFIDYGTLTEVSIKNIKFLASSFAKLPAQALRGSLSHIKPRDLHWSHEATTYFLSLVAEQMLYANITEINKEDNILYMILCNTNGEKVVQINKSLVEKHYALYNEEWKTDRIIENNGKRIHHPREDFPTFAMIESGEYPSFIELVNLQQRGIDYEAIYDVIIYNQSTILNKHENVPEGIKNLPYFLTTSNPFRSDILLELHGTTTKAI